jgi:hypothetical protein
VEVARGRYRAISFVKFGQSYKTFPVPPKTPLNVKNLTTASRATIFFQKMIEVGILVRIIHIAKSDLPPAPFPQERGM